MKKNYLGLRVPGGKPADLIRLGAPEEVSAGAGVVVLAPSLG